MISQPGRFTRGKLDHSITELRRPVAAAGQARTGLGRGLNGDHPTLAHEHHVERLRGAVHPEAQQGGPGKREPHAPQRRQRPAQLQAHRLLGRLIGHLQLDAGVRLQAPLRLDRQLLGRRGSRGRPGLNGEGKTHSSKSEAPQRSPRNPSRWEVSPRERHHSGHGGLGKSAGGGGGAAERAISRHPPPPAAPRSGNSRGRARCESGAACPPAQASGGDSARTPRSRCWHRPAAGPARPAAGSARG
jgi:hypothetical protein